MYGWKAPRARNNKPMPTHTSQIAMVDSDSRRISFHLVEIGPRGNLVHAAADLLSVGGHQFDIKRGAMAAFGQADRLAGLSPHFMVEIAGQFRKLVEMVDRAQRAAF